MKYGCDISRHQSADAVELLRKGDKADFIILRSSFGTYTEDEKFARYIKDTERLGFKNSIYHAAYAGTVAEAIEEADFCCDTLEKYGLGPADMELPIFYDYEYFSANYNAGRGIATTLQLVHSLTTAFCERVKERGYKAGVYFNKDYLDRFYTKDYFKAHPDYWRWYARPGYSAPDYDCELWQYGSDNGAEYGYNDAIDKNILYAEYLDGDIEVMKPLSEEPVRMLIGFATAGDIGTLTTYINGLGIEVDVKDGYILTKVPVSKGDQCYIMTEVNKLGNIDCVIYEEPQEKCVECEELRKQLDVEIQFKESYWQDVQRLMAENAALAESYGKASAEVNKLKAQLEAVETDEVLKAQLAAANKALSEQSRLNSELIKEIKPLREQLDKIREIVGG